MEIWVKNGNLEKFWYLEKIWKLGKTLGMLKIFLEIRIQFGKLGKIGNFVGKMGYWGKKIGNNVRFGKTWKLKKMEVLEIR